MSFNGDLRPVSESISIEILDAKGIKIFRRKVTTDEYGMAPVDLPLSDEPNLGVWKIIALTDYHKTQLDVRVEEYVLPKYEVSVEVPKEWFLVNEAIRGVVKPVYSYGKPVRGELTITAQRYVGVWEEYARITKEIDGEVDFELPPAALSTYPRARLTTLGSSPIRSAVDMAWDSPGRS